MGCGKYRGWLYYGPIDFESGRIRKKISCLKGMVVRIKITLMMLLFASQIYCSEYDEGTKRYIYRCQQMSNTFALCSGYMLPVGIGLLTIAQPGLGVGALVGGGAVIYCTLSMHKLAAETAARNNQNEMLKHAKKSMFMSLALGLGFGIPLAYLLTQQQLA